MDGVIFEQYLSLMERRRNFSWCIKKAEMSYYEKLDWKLSDSVRIQQVCVNNRNAFESLLHFLFHVWWQQGYRWEEVFQLIIPFTCPSILSQSICLLREEKPLTQLKRIEFLLELRKPVLGCWNSVNFQLPEKQLQALVHIETPYHMNCIVSHSKI